MPISVRSDEKKCYVTSTYHPDFVKAARQLNGKWVAPDWVFDLRDLERVRTELRKVYGTAGETVPTCTVCLTLSGYYGPDLYSCGRLIVFRKGRDEAARLGENLVVLSGGFKASGGSVKNPDIGAESGTVIEVRDVPVTLARHALTIPDPKTEIVLISSRETRETPASDRDWAIVRIREIMAEHGLVPADLFDTP